MNRPISRGYKLDPPVFVHPMILVGAGEMLTPEFKNKWNISHVVNCASDDVSPSWFRTEYKENYKSIGAIDSLDVNILTWYPEFKQILGKYLQDPNCTCIFVHCQCGINRSAFLALMYVCDVFKFSLESVQTGIIRKRPCALTNKEFKKQVSWALSKKAE